MYQHNIFCFFFSSSSSSSIELFHSSYCSAHHLSHFNPNCCFTSVVLIHSSRYSFCSASFLCFGVLFCCSSSSNVLFLVLPLRMFYFTTVKQDIKFFRTAFFVVVVHSYCSCSSDVMFHPLLFRLHLLY